MADEGKYRENSQPSEVVSGTFGVETITLVDSAGQGSNQSCREVTVWPETGESIKIGESAAVAATGPLLNDTEAYLRIPISNTNKLYFGGTTGKKVYLLWRS